MNEDSLPLLDVQGLTKHFPIYKKGIRKKQVGVVKAVDDVSFVLHRNETLGLVGESGCGKTTTARTVLRALAPTAGRVLFRREENSEPIDLATLSDRDLKPVWKDMQMIFQDPFSSLNPRMTVGQIISEPMVIHKMASGKDLDRRVDEILEKVGMNPGHKVRYPHAFSGGQRQRIGIARALIMNPSLVVADEAVSALDVSVQAQVINLLGDLKHDMNLSYIFVAHDLSVVRHICDRVAVMYAGRIVEIGPTRELFENPRHPYTRVLLSSVPNPDPDVRMNMDVSGEVADAGRLPPGCSFHPRCIHAQQGLCDLGAPPPLTPTGTRHEAACLRLKDIDNRE